MNNERYDIPKAYVFCNDNIKQTEKVTYYPIYMITFLEKEEIIQEMIYKPDLSVLM